MPGVVTLATADHLAPASGSSTPAPGAEPSAPEPAGARWERLAARIIAAAIALFGFLPLMNWVPGGYGDPLFGLMLTEWITGSSIVLGLGVVLAILTRRRANLFPALGADARRRIETWLPAAALAAYAAIALLVFDGRPLLFDEIVQVLQARIFASGRLWAPSFAHREFVEFLHMADLNGRVFSHFPPGGPAVLALGELVGLTWLVNPVCAAASVALFARIARRAEPRTGIALGASVLFAATPFAAFMSGSHMNHVTTLTFTLVGVLGMLLVMERDRVSLLPAFASGLGFGIAATIRPLDTLAYAQRLKRKWKCG